MVRMLFLITLLSNAFALLRAEDCHTLLRNIINPIYSDYKYFYKIDWELALKKINEFDIKSHYQTHTRILGYYDKEPIYRIDLKGIGNKQRKKVVILSGVHGNESIGVDISLNFIDEFLNDQKLRENYDFIFFPMVNPYGVKNNVRKTALGEDVNRRFIPGSEIEIALMIKKSLEGDNINMVLDLHEAVSQKNFFIVRNKDADDSFIDNVIKKIPDNYKLLSTTGIYPESLYSIKDSKEVSYILNAPGEATSVNPGTVKDYFYEVFRVKHSYSVECPKSMDIAEKRQIYKGILKLFLE